MKRSRFLDLFPPPVFLTMPAIGISLEGDTLRVVSFTKKHGRYILGVAKEYQFESGSINSNEIIKPDKVVGLLQKVKEENKAHYARVALPEENAYAYETIIPLPEEGEIGEAVEFSLDQNIPLTAAEAVSDFSLVEGPFTHNEVSSVRVAVSAYPRKIVETWLDLFTQAGIVPTVMMSESQALARSVVQFGDMRTTLVVHFLKDKTIIAVISAGLVRFATTVSGNNEAISKVLESHEGEQIAESVELLAVRDEVKKVLSYWMSKEGGKSRKEAGSIKSVVVTGYVSEMTDVAEYLGNHIGMPVSLGNVWQNAFSADDFVPDIQFEDSLKFAIASGVALPRN